MARGQNWWNEPPWWAWVGIVVGALVLILGVPLASGRGQLTQAEVERINADLAAEAVAEAAASAAAAEAVKLQITLPADRPLNVLFSGDSITHGSYATEPSRTWVGLVAAGLGGPEQVSVTNTAVSGFTVTEGLDEPIPDGVDLAFTMYGNNDVERSDLDTFRADYTTLLGKIKAENPPAQIVCVSPWLSPDYISEAGNATRDFVDVARQVCEAAGGVFVDITGLFSGGTLNAQEGDPTLYGTPAPDGGHPGDEGHAAIAQAALAAISVHPPTS